jgi:FixJ family two-component response regulator
MSRYTIFVVDDDAGVRKALSRLLSSSGFEVRSFASPWEFLRHHDPAAPGCVVLDLAMPGLNGLELQNALRASGCERFIVFLSAHGDIPSSVQAMKAGAVDFLTKPVDRGDLLRAIGIAIERDSKSRTIQEGQRRTEERLATLTPREREVLQHVVAGQLNKQIAADLGTLRRP